jgi:hypothetical protein
MLIVKLKGGLGNQMFQYAFGRALSSRTGRTVKFDFSYFHDGQSKPFRTFGLDNFECDVPEADAADVHASVRFGARGHRLAEEVGYRHPLASARLLRYRFEVQHPSWTTQFGVPQRWRFEPAVFDDEGPGFYNGYWQTERYFADVADRVRREFTVRHDLEGENRQVADEIEGSTAVSLHARRGDYVREDNAVPADYYEAALERIGETVTNPHVFVFSDDTEWVERAVSIPHPTTYVTHNDSETDYEDIRLMRLCDHHVIANSTFSWWGAWLNESDDKRVVAPGYWYDGLSTTTLDVVPDRWTVVDRIRSG